MTVKVLPVLLPFPEQLHYAPVGLLPAARVRRFATGLEVDRDVPPVYRELLDVVDAWAPPSYRHGTITGRVVEAPCTAGEWHRDDGTGGPDGALRFAVTVAADPWQPCGHEFREPFSFGSGYMTSGPVASGFVVRFTDDEHRRPEVPVAVRRVFLSVALYREGVEPDLSCVGLAPLRPEAVAS